MDLNKPHLIFLLTIINNGNPSPNKHLCKIYAILAQPQQTSSGWANGARWAEVLALTTYIHSFCITLACHIGTFMSLWADSSLCHMLQRPLLDEIYIFHSSLWHFVGNNRLHPYRAQPTPNEFSCIYLANTWLFLSNVARWWKIWLMNLYIPGG